uniref:Cytochrome c oxidase subunit 2 n=1 Tax=Pallisentis celatus TaxID=935648 RepID=V5IXB3_PALCE|nr:cytochrome c oxidase subunit II [Pallisentis celatus]AFK50141.1 cytochrome c oxidase subunit II [Pallisentis celatus]
MKWGLGGLMDSYGVFSEGLVSYFDWAILLSLVIFYFVFVLMLLILIKPSGGYFGSESVYLEFIWTLLPVSVLVFMGYPSILLMYMSGEELGVVFSCKVVGAQWYWVYEVFGASVSSYPEGLFRLLDVDNRLVIPGGSWVGVYLTSQDVIHSWALSSMGVKMDAIPGRLNYMTLFSGVSGVYYGQCSELCGLGHSFMPICVEVVY